MAGGEDADYDHSDDDDRRKKIIKIMIMQK